MSTFIKFKKPRKIVFTAKVTSSTYRKLRDLIQSEVVKNKRFEDVDEFLNYLVYLYKKYREF